MVTGASSGIGRQCAITCSDLGATVVLIGRNEERLSETLNLMDRPHNHLVIAADLTDNDLLKSITQQITEAKGKLHGIIHAAGISTTLPLRMINEDKLDHFFHTNVSSAILLTKLLVKPSVVSEEGMSVVFITSVMATVGEAGKTLYSMSKGALLAASRSMALELAPKKIRVNCVSPGVVETPMSQKAVYSQDESARNKIIDMHPLGLGEPQDVANTCAFLVSSGGKWITGANIAVDGGYTAR